MLRTERVAIEEHTERRTLEDTMRPAFRQTRALSPRQLPTDHDYAVSTREYQSDQPSQKLLDRLLALSLSGYPGRRSANQGCRSFPFPSYASFAERSSPSLTGQCALILGELIEVAANVQEALCKSSKFAADAKVLQLRLE